MKEFTYVKQQYRAKARNGFYNNNEWYYFEAYTDQAAERLFRNLSGLEDEKYIIELETYFDVPEVWGTVL